MTREFSRSNVDTYFVAQRLKELETELLAAEEQVKEKRKLLKVLEEKEAERLAEERERARKQKRRHSNQKYVKRKKEKKRAEREENEVAERSKKLGLM